MYTIALAGHYPQGTYDRLIEMLPSDQFAVTEISDADTYESMTEADIIILRIFKAPRKIIEQNKHLKMILRWGAGYDSVDIRAAGENGVIVTNTPGANADAVAELAIMLMLAVSRNLFKHRACMSKGEWSKDKFLPTSQSLCNKLVGIVGGGYIGRKVAEKVKGFGAGIQYFDVQRLPEEVEESLGMKYVDKDELLRTSDIVTLHVPLTSHTHHILGKNELMRMKTGAIVINTARGGLIDEKALVDCISSGKILGAGLDDVEDMSVAFDVSVGDELNIIVTPHIGGVVSDVGEKILPMLVEDICNFANGTCPKHIVNKQYMS